MAFSASPYAWGAKWLSLLLLCGAYAQQTSPSNNTSGYSSNNGFAMSTMLNNMATSIKLLPLTNTAGITGSTSTLQQINIQGPLYLTDSNNVNNLPAGAIAYISCEPSDYPGSIDAARTINLAVATRPASIVLYSKYAARCSFDPTTGAFMYPWVYSMEDSSNSSAVINGLNGKLPPNPLTSIHLDNGTTNGTASDSGSNNGLGRSPTTAVAMIILYSITGIITALFLIIIIVGAIRAHRHPERYGPRRIAGRARQSRAKGIARAMLETLPIVKFGDMEEEEKAAGAPADVEMGGVAHSENAAGDATREHAEGSDPAAANGPEVVKTEVTPASATAPDGQIHTDMPAVDQGLACSVCVEDFVKGQDTRVLPCKHKFHPECIDPWLLNVSGTCPLCRVDLRPTASQDLDLEEADAIASADIDSAADANATAPNTETTRHHHRRSRILHTLNIGRMRTATPEERLSALRHLRRERIASESTPGTNTRNRFSQRLSRAFGSRPVSMGPSEEGEAPARAQTPTINENHSTAAGPASNDPSRRFSHNLGTAAVAEVSPSAEAPNAMEANSQPGHTASTTGAHPTAIELPGSTASTTGAQLTATELPGSTAEHIR